MSVAVSEKLARDAVHTIQFLAVDAVEKANSGHPGTPMGMADVAFVLWSRYLRYDPTSPTWPDRDRFVLSAGHACMLLYSLLHLSGYDLPMSEIQRFRQPGSRTPGHPEFGHTPGVEATTGPLGQGIGNAVGIALAAKMLAARFNTADTELISHRVFVLASDGDVMEGVSGEASSIAGHLALGNLLVYYDDNRITIDGKTGITMSEDVGHRYEAYGWHVQRVDGHDHDAIAGATDAALGERGRPSLIVCRTHIAHGAPTKQDTAEAHGAPLGAAEVRATKEALGWPLEPEFRVPDDVRALFAARREEGTALRTGWEHRLKEWRASHPERAAEWDALHQPPPRDLVAQLLEAAPAKADATRGHGAAILKRAAELVPALVGGAADLASSTKTVVPGSPLIAAGSWEGRNLAFGVREHGMGAICNGLAYHGSFRPFASTFLIFSDYMRPSIRLAALSKLPVLYVFTHDSIFLGEDGPTHQPVEHVWLLRLIPGLDVWRPADAAETAVAFGLALLRRDGPSAVLLTRQKVPLVPRPPSGADEQSLGSPSKGASIVAAGPGAADAALQGTGAGAPHAVIVATGSELSLAVAARDRLAGEGRHLRVVSAPCLELFLRQDEAYRRKLLPDGVPVVTIEAGRTEPWRALSGPGGLNIGVDTFGASAPAEALAERYGLTAAAVAERIRAWMR